MSAGGAPHESPDHGDKFLELFGLVVKSLDGQFGDLLCQGVLEVPNAPIEGCVRENLQQGIVYCPLKVDNDELV